MFKLDLLNCKMSILDLILLSLDSVCITNINKETKIIIKKSKK